MSDRRGCDTRQVALEGSGVSWWSAFGRHEGFVVKRVSVSGGFRGEWQTGSFVVNGDGLRATKSSALTIEFLTAGDATCRIYSLLRVQEGGDPDKLS